MFIEVITTIVVLFLLSRVASKYKKSEISFKEAFLWGMLWILVGVVVIFPSIADKIAVAIGLKTATGIDLVVYMAVGFVFYLVFRIFVRIERIERDITKIIRFLAINKKEKDDI
jgi:small membrane protein